MSFGLQPPSFPTESILRVFIYSTLSDPEMERECLLRQIFPALCRNALEHGIGEPVLDIRWGPADTSPATYFSQIVRYHPLFIGILGFGGNQLPMIRRYNSETIAKDFPWLSDAAKGIQSLAEIGIIDRVLNDPLMYTQALFYIREDSPRDISKELTNKRAAKLEERIRKRETTRIYSNLESFKTLIWRDLMVALDRMNPGIESRSRLSRDRQTHQIYAAKHLPTYVERLKDIKKLDDYIVGSDLPMLVIGPSGAGKSALLSYWSERYRYQYPEAFLITHYVGVGSSARDHRTVIQRIMMEIRERYKLNKDIPSQEEDLVRRLPEWLAYVQGEQLILVIDAVDQLDEQSRELHWLPESFQPNVKVILSARETIPSGRGSQDRWCTLRVTPLSITERQQVIVKLLAPLGVSLTEKQSQAISSAALSSSPLSLRLILAQLGIYGTWQEEVIDSYLSANDLEAFYMQLFDRLEQGPSGERLQDVLSLIWGSRSGLTEAELEEITKMTPEKLSPLLIALNPYLIRQNGRMTFFHDSLRQTVEVHCTLHGGIARRLHARLAKYFAKQQLFARRIEEEPWQWQQAHKWAELRRCITDIPMFLALHSEGREYQLIGYWMALEKHYKPAEHYQRELARYEQAEHAHRRTDLVMIFQSLGRFFQARGEYSEAEAYFRRALSELKVHSPVDTIRTADFTHALGELLRRAGRFQEAEAALRDSLEIYEHVLGKEHEQVAQPLSDLALLLHHTGDIAGALPLYQRAVDIKERTVGVNHPIMAESISDLALAYQEFGDHETALQRYERAIDIYRAFFGNDHPMVATILNNEAGIYRDRQNFDEAEKLYREALDIRERMMGREHPETLIPTVNLASLLRARRNYLEARPLFERSLAGLAKTIGTGHPDYASVSISYAQLLNTLGELTAAENELREALVTCRREMSRHPTTAVCLYNLAGIRRRQGDTHEAYKLFSEALPIWESILDPDNLNISATLQNLAEILQIHAIERSPVTRKDHLRKAEIYLRRTLEIREQKLGRNNSRTLQTIYVLATVLDDNGKGAEAAPLLQEFLSLQCKNGQDQTPEMQDAIKRLNRLRGT